MTKRITEPRKRTRTVQIKFWATPEEKELIEKKMALTGIVHMGAYLRKMAIDGYVVNLEIQEFKATPHKCHNPHYTIGAELKLWITSELLSAKAH